VARGWESKGVEDQIEEEKLRAEESARVEDSLETRLRGKRLESLKLSRSRVLEQLERARLPAQRVVLMKGLRAIEKEMEEVSHEEPRPRGEKNP
jgi:hypothetical protein